jgi:predicted phage tail protein
MTAPLAQRRRKVVLHGHLADAVGQSEFLLAVKSPSQAVRLLEANFPKVFSGALQHGSYHVVVGEPNHGIYCNDNFLDFYFPDGTIHFIPAISGSGMGKGMVMAIIGVSILAIALTGGAAAGGLFGADAASAVGASSTAGFMGGMGAAIPGTSIFGGMSWGTLALAGTAIALAGISIMLTPAAGQNYSSFTFNGAANTDTEGVCVPLVYGRVIAGSVVVSAGLYNESLNPVTLAVVSSPPTENSLTFAIPQQPAVGLVA